MRKLSEKTKNLPGYKIGLIYGQYLAILQLRITLDRWEEKADAPITKAQVIRELRHHFKQWEHHLDGRKPPKRIGRNGVK